MNTGNLALRQWWIGVGWALVVLVVYLSLAPVSEHTGASQVDKFGHLLAYATLMFWFSCLYSGSARIYSGVGFVAMGVALEGLQSLTSYRTFEFMDMVANGVGVGLGWGAALSGLDRMLLWLDRRCAGFDIRR